LNFSSGSTIRKETAAATDTNVISALTKSPWRSSLPLIVKLRLPKPDTPAIATMIA